jgi:hypothetical protein
MFLIPYYIYYIYEVGYELLGEDGPAGGDAAVASGPAFEALCLDKGALGGGAL